jgi:hypothetical protein
MATKVLVTKVLVIKVLVINSGMHEKNKQGLIRLLQEHQPEKEKEKEIKYKFGSVAEIPEYDIIYSPSQTINTSLYPQQKFIFGPHFSTFPNHSQLQSLQNHVHHNSIYIQPSDWVVQLWKNMGAEQFLPVKTFAFPVDTDTFKPCTNPNPIKDKVLIYSKHRNPNELHYLTDFLHQQQITNYRIFDYHQRYQEDDYLAYLQQSKYGIILDAHESQGFAIEEALACDVPLLVWNAQTMNQEYNSQYHPIPCTSIPYWNDQCGEYFHHPNELPATFHLFQSKLQAQKFNPRQYILDNLSSEKCAERFMTLFNF